MRGPLWFALFFLAPLVLYFVAILTPNWLTDGDMKFGLFRYCFDRSSVSGIGGSGTECRWYTASDMFDCSSSSNDNDGNDNHLIQPFLYTSSRCTYQIVAQALGIVALIFSAFATLTVFCSTWAADLYAASAMGFFSGVCGAISMGVWVYKFDSMKHYDYGYSFILFVIAWCLCVIAPPAGHAHRKYIVYDTVETRQATYV